MVSLRESVRKVAYSKPALYPVEWDNWADAYIKELEEHMRVRYRTRDAWETGYMEARLDMLRFLRGETK